MPRTDTNTSRIDTARSAYSVIAAIGLFAAGLIWISSPWGIGTTPDSIEYLQYARSLGEGGSFLEWGRHWPPAYPLLLAAINACVDSIQDAARIAQAMLFGLNTVLIGSLVYRGSGRIGVAGIAAAFYFSLHFDAYAIHYLALSEGLFVTLLLAQLLAWEQYFVQEKLSWLMLVAVLGGLGILTRYAGLALVGSGGLFLLLAGNRNISDRLSRSAGYVLVSLSLPLAWLLASSLTQPGEAPRTLALHPVDADRLRNMALVILGWFQSRTLGPWLSSFLAVSAAAVIAIACRSRPGITVEAQVSLPRLIALSVIGYLAFLLLSVSFFDFYTPLDSRILLPAFVLTMTAAITALFRLSPVSSRFVPTAFAALVILALVGLPQYLQLLGKNTRDGDGYFSRRARQLPIMLFLKKADFPVIYSNGPRFISLYLDSTSLTLPTMLTMQDNRLRKEYSGEMDAMLATVNRGEASIVFLETFAWRAYFPSREILDRIENLKKIYEEADGIIYVGNAPTEK